MGSVSDSYRCPLCGRTGNGGYHVDGLGIGPICTEGPHACLMGLCDGSWISVADFFYAGHRTRVSRKMRSVEWLAA